MNNTEQLDWFAQIIAKARKQASPGHETMAEAKAIEFEVTRRAKLATKHREWVEIWGLNLNCCYVYDLEEVILEAVAQKWVPEWWRWIILHTTIKGNPKFSITGCFRDEKMIISIIEFTQSLLSASRTN